MNGKKTQTNILHSHTVSIHEPRPFSTIQSRPQLGRGRETAKQINTVGSSDKACLDSYQSCVNIEARAKMLIGNYDA